MFLPVLFVRDYGLAGWFVFTIPNVIGAASMGWVLARPGASERVVAQHRTACVAFSAVTLAFHAFFLTWLAWRVIPVEACIAAVVVGCALAGLRRSDRRIDLVLGWIVFAVSVAVLAHGLAHPRVSERRGLKDAMDLIWLAPVCVFGFALCPYLDVTFHRARQLTSGTSGRLAFGIGFGLFFLAMIVLTLLYEGDFVHGNGYGSFGDIGLRTWVATHLAVQCGFTWMVHLRSLPPARRTDAPIWIGALLLAVCGGVIVWIEKLAILQLRHSQMLSGEAIYRIFMAFYGLVFPAYVWICMVPIAGFAPGPTRRALAVCAAVVVVAAPMFWMAFIVGTMWWLAPGLLVMIAARALVSPRAAARAG